MITLVIFIVVIAAVLGLAAMFIYNELVKHREHVRSAYAQIDVQLERRHDLIPNLVDIAKVYMSHERETLEGVVNARAAATQALIKVGGDSANLDAMQRLGTSEGALGASLGRLLAVAEDYPDLKANQKMADLSAELAVTEDRIAYSRQHYNDRVNDYRTYKGSFPPVILAGAFRFRDSAYLDLTDQAHQRGAIQITLDD